MITLEIPHEIFPLMIAVICFLVPVIGLLLFVFIIKFIINFIIIRFIFKKEN